MDEHKRQVTTFSRSHRDFADDVGSSRVDVLIGLTMDVIGEAGFSYQFNAIDPNGQPNELEQALVHLFPSAQSQREAVPVCTGIDMLVEKKLRRDGICFPFWLYANMSDEIPEDQKLSDADVIAQMTSEIPTFFVAGNETTSLALHALSINILVQTKLREELLSLPTNDPPMDELNSLPYL
ncbi:hypothetical protein C8R44DRAFT_742140 [Mycena epipterygia]|nr:hypothetical protein C8R44DRAFT_742140 [Mycena epipterygia]